MKIIKILNGPNLNMLGFRDKELYGDLILEQINATIVQKYTQVKFEFFQSNHEGEFIDFLQQTHISGYDNVLGVIVNPAALTHTSVAIRDTLELMTCIKVEVHLSNLTTREAFRQVNLIKDVVDAQFMGKKEVSYYEAVEFILSKSNLN